MFINRWNVAVFPNERKASKELFNEMYDLKGQPFIGDNEWKQRSLELGYKMRGAMAGSMHATMEIHIKKQDLSPIVANIGGLDELAGCLDKL